MTGSRVILLASVMCLSLLATSPASAQFNTFTSGGPPIGDGNEYPRSLNPSAQVGGGASVDTFFSDLVGYTNSSGNPAFFDSNNLLTRPASLINGDAFWTDPRVGNFVGSSGNPFSIAQVGFEFFDASFDSFGFDIAVASASGAVPQSLPFQIQDFDSDQFGFGSLVLDPDAGGDGGDVFPFDSGTFFTLGGRQGREARYRIDKSEIESLIGGSLAGGSWFLDIDLEGIATFGGTTQVAIDNFVLDGAVLPGPTPEPVYLPPTPPIGPNRPQYFNYASTTNDQSDGDSYDFASEDLGDGRVNITFTGSVAAEDSSQARAEGGSANVTFNASDVENGQLLHEIEQLQETVLDAVEEELRRPIGPSYGVTNGLDNGQGGTQPGDAPSEQVVDVRSTLWVFDDSQAFEFAAMQNGMTPEVLPLDSPEIAFEVVTTPAGSDSLLALATAPGDEPMYYLNYTTDDYFVLKELLNEAPIEGDSGSFVTAFNGDDGQPVSFLVSTWTVTSQGGIFTPVFTTAIPEPGTVALLTLGFFVVRRRARLA